MKKIVILLIFVITFSLSGCKKTQEDLPLALSLEHIILNETEKGFEVTVNSNLKTYKNQAITDIGVIYGLDIEGTELTKENALAHGETSLNESGKYIFIFGSIDQEDYAKSLIARAYIIYGENAHELSTNTKTFTLYNLAKSDPSSFGKWIVAFVEDKIVSTVSLTVDTKKYTATTNDLGYTVALYTDYNIIRLTVTLDSSYLFDDSVILIVNDQSVSPTKWIKHETTIIYVFDDPNWTGPY